MAWYGLKSDLAGGWPGRKPKTRPSSTFVGRTPNQSKIRQGYGMPVKCNINQSNFTNVVSVQQYMRQLIIEQICIFDDEKSSITRNNNTRYILQ